MPGLLKAARALPQQQNRHGAEQALSLLTQPLSKDLPERHLASLEHMCAELKYGCSLRDLPVVSGVLAIVVGNVKAEPGGRFLEVACELLTLHASDDLVLAEKISDLLQVVRQCLEDGMPAALSCSAAALLEDFFGNFQTPTEQAASIPESAPSCLTRQAHIRLLAENNICSAVVQALERAVGLSKEPSSMPHDFSIAAVHPSTTANAKKNVGLSNSHLISALLQAAVAFSTSQQLSEQLLSSGVMSPVALLLNRGGVHNRHNSQVVELLWNLLEACPLYDAHTKNSHAAANSALAAWHSQILKPRQKTTDPKQAAAIFGEGQGGNDSNDQVSTGRPGDTASADVEVQQQDDDAQANGKYGDAACTLASTAGEGCTQELQEPCAACPADYSISAAGSPAGTETASATPAATGDVTTAGDAADTAEEGAPGPTLDSGCAPAESCLSAESNSQTCASRDTSPSASASQDHQSAADEPGKSAVAGCEEAATIGLTAEVGVVEEVAIGISRVLADCLEHGYSTADKELRNTVLVVAGMLAQSRRYRNAFCRLEMLQQLLVTSTEPELGDCSTACFRASRQSIDGEDFELRQLAWTNLARLLQHNPACVSSQAHSFFRVLLQYIQPDEGFKDWPLHWTHPQLSTLRQVALGILQSMVPSFPQVYEECGGPARILQFLAGCSDSMLLETGLHHMHQACTASPLLCATWAGQGSMELALAVAADSTWPLRVRRSALLLVSVLCRGSPDAARQFLQLEGVSCLCLELEKLKLVGNEAATLYDFAVLDAVWSGIVQSPAALQCFLLADGLGGLLDLLDQGAAALRQLLLTIIADVLGSDSGKHIQATDLFYEWVSSRQQSACHIILELWRQEEAGRGVATLYCRATQQRSTCLSPRLAAAAVGTASKSSSSAMHMKIHAVFSQTGFAEAAAHMDLPDQATLCAVEQYIALQQGLVWQNMADRFAGEGLDPTEEDQLRIEDGIKRAADIRRSVQDQQQALMQKHADQLMQAELEFVRAKRAQDERDAEARRYHKDMSTLTVKERLAAKAKREQMLLESFTKEEEALVFEDELALEAFSRRPSHAAQHETMERLSGSPNQAARDAADLLIKQYPDQKMETRVRSPKATARGVSNNIQVERRMSDFAGMDDTFDYDDLQRDSASDESDGQGYDSD